MPTVEVSTFRVVHERGKGSEARDTISKIFAVVASVGTMGVLDWDFDRRPVQVEVSEYQLEQKPKGYIADLVAAFRRDN
jgi:hypothetical protein